MRTLIYGLLSTVVIVLVIAICYPLYKLYKLPMQQANACFIQSNLETARDHNCVLRFAPNQTAANLVRAMKDQHLIESEAYLLWFIRYKNLSAHLKAGVYEIKPEETAVEFIARVVRGDVLTKLFLIKPGLTHKQVAHDLILAPYLNYVSSDWNVISGNPEGQLLADSYQYNADSSAKAILCHAHDNLERYLQKAWQNRALDLPYHTSYQLLIVASILEKEAALPEEKRLISGVIVNRLKKYMPLQMDPTVIYALQSDYQGKLTHNDLKVDSPYNTYRRRGLPPTPIAMVGKDAIDAAAHPTNSSYLYFVARGDGSHEFSSNYLEQKKAINRYLIQKKMPSNSVEERR